MAVSVAAAVKTIINRSPFISEMLIQEVISFSNLAKSIQPKVESLHGDKVNTAAIVMAIRRYAEELKASQKEIGSGKIRDLNWFSYLSAAFLILYLILLNGK